VPQKRLTQFCQTPIKRAPARAEFKTARVGFLLFDIVVLEGMRRRRLVVYD
jgi:hypothetical protein